MSKSEIGKQIVAAMGLPTVVATAIPSSSPEDVYIVLYRSGGWANCTWTRLASLMSKEGASDLAAAVELGGRKTIVRSLAEHDLLGMPVGWNWRLVDWQRDTIVTNTFMTEHTIPAERHAEVRYLLEAHSL